MRYHPVLFALAVTAGAGGALSAQTTYPSVKITGRLQEQFYTFGNADYAATVGPRSSFFTRRARIEARGNISESVSFLIQPSFEDGRALSASTSCSPIIDPQTGGPDTLAVNCTTSGRSGVRLRDAWIDVRFTKPENRTGLYLRFGQEKRPFGRYELTSSTNLPSIERGAGKGLVGAASNNLFEGNGYLAHDVGAHARLERRLDDAGRLATVIVGVYNGRGESALDNNSAKSYGARAVADVYRKLSLGGSWFSRDAIVGADSTFRTTAWGVDAAWSKPGEAGLYAVADYMQGEAATAARTPMRGVSAVAAYHVRMTSPTSWLYAIEPAVRFDYADPNTDTASNGSTLITGVLGFYVSSKAQFRLGVEHQSFQAPGAASITGVRTAMAISF